MEETGGLLGALSNPDSYHLFSVRRFFLGKKTKPFFCSIHESGPRTKQCKKGMVFFGCRAQDRVSRDF